MIMKLNVSRKKIFGIFKKSENFRLISMYFRDFNCGLCYIKKMEILIIAVRNYH